MTITRSQIDAADKSLHDKATARKIRYKKRQKTQLARKRQRLAQRIDKMLLRHMKRAVRRGKVSYRRGYAAEGEAIFRQRMWRAMFFLTYNRIPCGSGLNRYSDTLYNTKIWARVEHQMKVLRKSHFPNWKFRLSIAIPDWEGNNHLDGVIATYSPPKR